MKMMWTEPETLDNKPIITWWMVNNTLLISLMYLPFQLLHHDIASISFKILHCFLFSFSCQRAIDRSLILILTLQWSSKLITNAKYCKPDTEWLCTASPHFIDFTTDRVGVERQMWQVKVHRLVNLPLKCPQITVTYAIITHFEWWDLNKKWFIWN